MFVNDVSVWQIYTWKHCLAFVGTIAFQLLVRDAMKMLRTLKRR